MVVQGGTDPGASSRSAQSGYRCTDECAWSARRQLALALHKRHAIRARLPMAGRLNRKIESIPCSPTNSAFSTNCRGKTMKATHKLHDLGQSLWLDNITRDLLTSGTLKGYIEELSV